MKPSAPSSETVAAPGMPSEPVRTIVTLLLFIHLFAVGLAIMTNNDTGGSQLIRDVRERPRFIDSFLTQFWLNRGYNYFLMNNENWDFHLEATVKYADGRTEGPILLPESDVWMGERRQRYQQLAGFVSQYIARGESPDASELDAERKLLLPQSIGGSLLGLYPGAESVSLKCIYHQGMSREASRSAIEQDRDPFNSQYFITIPNGDVTIVMDRGRPTVFENLPAAEVSPVLRPGTATSKAVPPASGKTPSSASGK